MWAGLGYVGAQMMTTSDVAELTSDKEMIVFSNLLQEGKEDDAIELLSTLKDIVTPRGDTTFLHEAAYHGSLAACEYLLERGADPTLRDGLGLRPKEHASSHETLHQLLADSEEKELEKCKVPTGGFEGEQPQQPTTSAGQILAVGSNPFASPETTGSETDSLSADWPVGSQLPQKNQLIDVSPSPALVSSDDSGQGFGEEQALLAEDTDTAYSGSNGL